MQSRTVKGKLCLQKIHSNLQTPLHTHFTSTEFERSCQRRGSCWEKEEVKSPQNLPCFSPLLPLRWMVAAAARTRNGAEVRSVSCAFSSGRSSYDWRSHCFWGAKKKHTLLHRRRILIIVSISLLPLCCVRERNSPVWYPMRGDPSGPVRATSHTQFNGTHRPWELEQSLSPPAERHKDLANIGQVRLMSLYFPFKKRKRNKSTSKRYCPLSGRPLRMAAGHYYPEI